MGRAGGQELWYQEVVPPGSHGDVAGLLIVPEEKQVLSLVP